MRRLLGFLCVCALGVAPLVGCSETAGDGGFGGSAGSGGVHGIGGYSGYPTLCDGVECDDQDECTDDRCDYRDGSCEHTLVNCDDDNECTDDVCNSLDGCHYTTLNDGTSCGDGAAACQGGSCVGTFACTEAGIRQAIAVGAGPHTFLCAGPSTVVTEAEILIDNDVILDAEGNLTVDAGYHGGELTGNEHPVFSVKERVIAELRAFTVTGGYGVRGGGIRNSWGAVLTLKDTSVSGNSGDSGIDSSGTLMLMNSAVSGNAGVGISSSGGSNSLMLINSTVSGNSGVSVGGIRSSNGMLILANSTVSRNMGGDIGGILNVNYSASMLLANSTVSANTGSLCDGIDNEGRSGTWIVAITNSTVLGDTGSVCSNVLYPGKTASDLAMKHVIPGWMSLTNGAALPHAAELGAGGTGGTAGGGGSGGFGGWPGEFTLTNSLIQGDCDADINSLGYNIESPGNTCGFDQTGDQPSVPDPMLGPLQNNGGPTMTHALLPGSAAINRIPLEDCLDADGAPLATDQRGEPRPETGGTMCDVGAFERQTDEP